MIVSASYRTDIPAFYGDWLMRRVAAGWCDVTNPYGGPPYRVALDRDSVDGFVFWTKNLTPFIDSLSALRAQGYALLVHYTINRYPRCLETAVTDAARAIAHMRMLAATLGPRAAVWRYDPILATSRTPLSWHLANFAALAKALAGSTDEVVISFAHVYRKTRRNLTAAGRAEGFDWYDPEPEEKRALAARMAAIAADHGMRLSLCAQPELLASGVAAGRCIDAGRLADVAGRPIRARRRGNRPGCECDESRDIGAYDSCPHGCVYCYAVSDHARARHRFRAHDAENPRLGDST